MPPAVFDLVEVEAAPHSVVEVRGEIDANNAAAFQRELEAIGVSHPLVLDLSPLQYFDSAGFAVLDRLLARRSLTIVISPSCVLRRAAVLMGIPFHASVEQARDALAATP